MEDTTVMMIDQFNARLNTLTRDLHAQGAAATSVVNLLIGYPQWADKVLDVICHEPVHWNGIPLRQVWCGLVAGHSDIGKDGLTHEQWQANCRRWLASQDHISTNCHQHLEGLLAGFGTVSHPLHCVEMLLEQAQEWGGEEARTKLAQSIATIILAICLDRPTPESDQLLRKFMGLIDVDLPIGKNEKHDWVPMWAMMVYDGSVNDHIENVLDILVEQGVRLDGRDERGLNTMEWVARTSNSAPNSSFPILARVIGALLSNGWPLDDARKENFNPKVWALLESHPVVLRAKLMDYTGIGELDDEEPKQVRM